VANRLTHGVDKESEENIMSLAFMFQKCNKIPKPRIFSEPLGKKEEKEQLEQLVKKVFNERDPELLSRLQDLPYLNPKYKLNS
jgi:hypothetical protein